MKLKFAFSAALLALASQGFAQTKWDLPAAYPTTNFHTENLIKFAEDVDKATAGKLKIQVHANASLFKAPEIKRAVQGGQAQIGEILLVNYQNEWQIFGADGLPFLADGYDSKTYEHIKNWYDTQAWLPKNGVLVNKKAFEALDKPTQDALLKAAADAETRGWAASRAENTRTLDLLKKNGMSIVAPSAQLTADMKKVGETMLTEWLEKAGPEGKQLVDAYRK